MRSHSPSPWRAWPFSARLLALALLLFPRAGGAEDCQAPGARYTVTRVSADRFAVTADFEPAVERLDLFFFPVEGRPEGQADSIRALAASDRRGEAVAISYLGEGGWSLASPAARVRYEVIADHDQVNWGRGGPGKDEVAGRFDATYFFVGHAFFLTAFEGPDCPIEVRFDLPEDWSVTAPWPIEDGIATVAGPWSLAQNAFAMGLDPARTSHPGDLEMRWLVDSRLRGIGDRVEGLMSALPVAYGDFWAGAPGKAYTAFFLADTMSDGGAFLDSFAMRIAVPLTAVDEISWSHTLGHEVMHLWNGSSGIQPASASAIQWFTEGFTDFLTVKLMYQAGLIDRARLEQRLANFLRRFELAKRLSPGVPLAEAGRDKLANWELIYGGGALIALLMDAEISAVDPRGFRAALRDLYSHSKTPYDQGRLMERLNASTSGRAGEIFAFVDSRPLFGAIRSRLGAVGIDVSYFGSDEVYVAVRPDVLPLRFDGEDEPQRSQEGGTWEALDDQASSKASPQAAESDTRWN